MISQKIQIKPEDICTECKSPISASLRCCPTCKADLGAPNVRLCKSDENSNALNARYQNACKKATSEKCLKTFKELEEAIKKNSVVVITMPASVARNLFENPVYLYNNYENLVGANIRTPAVFNDDRQRSVVGACLFGSYANCIVYGALSLATEGLPTYGELCCRLKNKAIEKRTSFLETNSFKFVEEHNITASKGLPLGYMACWEQRHLLVLIKLAERISDGQTESEWQELLIQSDSQNRKNDDFIEAHIYDNLNRYAVEAVVQCRSKKLNKAQQLDIDLAIESFNKIGASRS